MNDLDDLKIQRPKTAGAGLDPDLSLRAGVAAESPDSGDEPAPAPANTAVPVSPPYVEPASDLEADHEGDGGGGARWIAAGVLLFLLVCLVGYFFWLRSPKAPSVGTVADSPRVEREAPAFPRHEPAEEATSPSFELPELTASDAVLRTMAATLSRHPKVAQWLVHDDLLRRFTLVVANAAYDEDPAVHVPFLRPEGGFQASAAGEGFEIGAETYRRYNTLVEVFISLDVAGAASLYRDFEPLIEQQYSELGYPGRFQTALRRAALRVLETPVPEAEPGLEPWINGYRFADPELEALAPVQKQLVRMGPSHQRRVQEQVRRLLTEIDRATRD